MKLCVFAKGEPPEELTLAWQAHRWNALPEAGGLLDQPAGLIERMAYAENMYNAYKLWHDGRAVELANNNPDLFDFIVVDLGIFDGD